MTGFQSMGLTRQADRETSLVHPTSSFVRVIMGVGFGARGRVPAAKAERPLSVQLGDLRREARQRARRADFRPSPLCYQSARFGPNRNDAPSSPAQGVRVAQTSRQGGANDLDRLLSGPSRLAELWNKSRFREVDSGRATSQPVL